MADVKKAMNGGEIEDELAEKLRAKPFRAPTIIAVIATVRAHPKVPEIEQVLSAGASAQMMVTAAHALGLGAIWRSGSLMFAPEMRQGLGLAATDQIVGFLYIGTPGPVKVLPERDSSDYVEVWSP